MNSLRTPSTMSKFLPCEEALAVAQSLGLASQFEWKEWCKEGMCPPNVPRRPDQTHTSGGWQGRVHWLGSGGIKKASKFVSFEQPWPFPSPSAWPARTKVWCKEGRRPLSVHSPTHKPPIGAAGGGGGATGWGPAIKPTTRRSSCHSTKHCVWCGPSVSSAR